MNNIETRKDKLLSIYQTIIGRQLIEGQLNIDQLPDEIRLSSRFRINYVQAFRGSRCLKNTNYFVRTLEQLDKDLAILHSRMSQSEVAKCDDFLMYNAELMFERYRGQANFDDFLANQKKKRPLLYKAYFGEKRNSDNLREITRK